MEDVSQKLESMFELAAILGNQNDFQEILRLVSSRMLTLLDAEMASIMMINPQTRETVRTIIKGGKTDNQQQYQLAQTNVIGLVLEDKQSFLSVDLKKDDRFRKDLFKDIDVGSVLCVPMRNEDIVVGCLFVSNRSGERTFDDKTLKLLEKLAVISTPFLTNAQKLQEYFNAPLPRSALLNKYEPLDLFGESKQFIELLRAVEAVARSDVRVLLEGKTGTGKELIARAIHRISQRNQYPFVAVDCGAVPHNLIESELFGHITGAFTGANHDRKGLFLKADQGTLFLDEVTNLPVEVQSKLMRVLQEGEVRPLGSDRVQKVNVRIISASSASLTELVRQHRFREDLYYRLLVYPIQVPTLDERRADIPLLANHFLIKFTEQQQKRCRLFHGEILEFIKQRSWPGNIRELENFVERLVTLTPADATILDPSVISADLRDEYHRFEKSHETDYVGLSLNERLQECEEQILRQALIDSNWNQSSAARSLKISEQVIRYRMKKLGIIRPD
jgi:transcriptional regulator with GAF, ATPase, and Fis domain